MHVEFFADSSIQAGGFDATYSSRGSGGRVPVPVASLVPVAPPYAEAFSGGMAATPTRWPMLRPVPTFIPGMSESYPWQTVVPTVRAMPRPLNPAAVSVPSASSGPCSGAVTLSSPSGSLSDGPSDYLASQTCAWTISTGSAITLSFSDFATEAGYDFVKVFDGSSSTAALLGSFSGSSNPGTVTATSGTMHVEFFADSSIQAGGFEATYSSHSSGVGIVLGPVARPTPEGAHAQEEPPPRTHAPAPVGFIAHTRSESPTQERLQHTGVTASMFLRNYNPARRTVDLWLVNALPISGFQVDVIGAGVSGGSGGTAAANGLAVHANGKLLDPAFANDAWRLQVAERYSASLCLATRFQLPPNPAAIF